MPHLFVDLWEANMKTYKDLLKQDYDYLDSLRYGIGKTLKEKKYIIQPVIFDPKLLVTIDKYYPDKLNYYVFIINILVKQYSVNESDLHNLYIREGVIKHKNMMLDCIEECIGLLYSALCEEKNNK